ncbi:MAG: AraC family transcriptional regulator ligand-binding domain-containing protein [Gammaproteobacteria bacterium]
MSATVTQAARPTIPITYTRVIARTLGLQEKQLDTLVAGSGLGGASVLADDTLITSDQQLQVVRNALRLAGDDGLGLRIGRALTPPTHGALGFLANTSPDLASAIDAFRQYLPARVSFTHLRLRRAGELLECHFDVDLDRDADVYRCIVEAFSLSLLAMIEHVLGEPLTRGRLLLDYPAPPCAAAYADYVSCPVEFAAGASLLVLPASLLATPNATADVASHRFAQAQCRALLEGFEGGRSSADRVRRLLLSMPAAAVDEEAVARALFVSKRTLARRLAAEGSGFRALRDEVFAALAARYLADTTLTVEAVAGLLGYHDAANFRRAFKRWRDITPERFRARLTTTAGAGA